MHKHTKPTAKMSKAELVLHIEGEHERELPAEATVAELRKAHSAMSAQEAPGIVPEPEVPSGAEDDCVVILDFPKGRGEVPDEPIPVQLAQLGITNVGPEGRRSDNIACAMAILAEGKTPEQAHRLKGLSHLSSAAIRYRASRAEVASGLRDCRCKDGDCGFAHKGR